MLYSEVVVTRKWISVITDSSLKSSAQCAVNAKKHQKCKVPWRRKLRRKLCFAAQQNLVVPLPQTLGEVLVSNAWGQVSREWPRGLLIGQTRQEAVKSVVKETGKVSPSTGWTLRGCWGITWGMGQQRVARFTQSSSHWWRYSTGISHPSSAPFLAFITCTWWWLTAKT